MSPGLQTAIASRMWSAGLVPKARYTTGMSGTTFACKADVFPGTSFGWFCPWPISLIAWRNVPPLALLNVG